MESEMILELHAGYTQTKQYQESDDREAMDKIRLQSYNEVEKIVGEDTYLAIEDSIATASYEAESHGFVMGFKFAAKLMAECGFSIPAVVKS